VDLGIGTRQRAMRYELSARTMMVTSMTVGIKSKILLAMYAPMYPLFLIKVCKMRRIRMNRIRLCEGKHGKEMIVCQGEIGLIQTSYYAQIDQDH
jgi:hypothetical protein